LRKTPEFILALLTPATGYKGSAGAGTSDRVTVPHRPIRIALTGCEGVRGRVRESQGIKVKEIGGKVKEYERGVGRKLGGRQEIRVKGIGGKEKEHKKGVRRRVGGR